MAILDNNIVNVALPKIMANCGATVDQIEWVVTGYMIAFAISMPATSWLREVFGLKKVFTASLALFCFGSALCGLAWDKDSLIAFRVIQAIGGGAMMPTGLTLVPIFINTLTYLCLITATYYGMMITKEVIHAKEKPI